MRLILLLSASMVLAAGAARAQDAGAVLAANHAATGDAPLTAKATARIDYAYSGQGLTGTVSTTYDRRSGVFVDSFDLGPTAGANGFDGRQAWWRDMSGAVTPQDGGDIRRLAVNEAYRDADLWWRADRGGATIRDLGSRTDDGATYEVLSVAPAGGKPFEAWFDARTHLLARTVEAQSAQVITTFFSDYRAVDGQMVAGKQLIDDGTGAQYRQTQTLSKVDLSPGRPVSAYAAPSSPLTGASIDNPAGQTTVPFRLLNNHIYAEVMVNGKGPFLCIFDTGGHDLLIPETAKALAVKSEGAAAGMGAGEGVVDTGFARDVTFKIGDLTIKDPSIAVLPFEADAVEGLKEQGMIGFEVFRRFVTRIDYQAMTLTFTDPARFDPKGAGTVVPFVFYNHLPEVEGSFEGVPARFDIDTGSRAELTLTKPFVEAHGLMARHPKGVTAVDGWGVGGRAVSYVTRGAQVSLGPVKVDGVVTGFGTQAKGAFADPNYDGNVGTALLKRFVVTFDYGRQRMYLKPITPVPADAGMFDRAGFWINASAKGVKIVDLTAGGAAAVAGMKAGDEITAVDGAPAGSIPLSDLRQRLRDGKPGTVVKLDVDRAGQPMRFSLVLADQI